MGRSLKSSQARFIGSNPTGDHDGVRFGRVMIQSSLKPLNLLAWQRTGQQPLKEITAQRFLGFVNGLGFGHLQRAGGRAVLDG